MEYMHTASCPGRGVARCSLVAKEKKEKKEQKAPRSISRRDSVAWRRSYDMVLLTLV